MSEKRQINTYTNEFKKSAVELAIRSNSIAQTAQDLGVSSFFMTTAYLKKPSL
ncbi:transposase [Magnetococcales bacterium HHB-1]